MALRFPDDDDAFLAALSFVDEFPFDEEGVYNTERFLMPPQCSEPVKLDLNEVKQRRRRQVNERKKLLRKAGVYADPNRARSERRQEIARLREQLEQLQLDVQVLRGRETKRRRSAEGGSPIALSLPPQVPAVWQEMALRQRQLREEAERENIHLKLVVKRQQQVAQTLGVLVRRRAFQATKECADLTTQSSLKHHVVNVLDSSGSWNITPAVFLLSVIYQRDQSWNVLSRQLLFRRRNLSTTLEQKQSLFDIRVVLEPLNR
ncbi:hypothetical protein V7S43_017256 [Phytophthora oleae]|uniref:BZIP domain-containing protein n=1 Tax=Phytophthora oleae TaxID=2107226 RepID=A0ABD3ETT7_9STRA